MKIHCQYTKLIPLSELKPNPENENEHTKEQAKRLAEILEYQGFRKPIIISNQTGLMVTGHLTREAAKLNKYKEVPVSFQDFEGDQETAHRIADNAIASWSVLNLSKVNIQVPTFDPNFSIDLLGIKDFQIDPADKYADQDADACPEVKESFVKPGDLWILGNHRLLCGDSTDKAQVERLMSYYQCDCGEIHG